MKDNALRDFILTEMKKRDMSAREFARYIGVSNTTINRFVDYGEKYEGYPSIDFVERLATATNTRVSTIMGLILPHLAERDGEDPETLLLVKQFQALPETEYRMVAAFIRSVQAKVETKEDDSKE